MRILIIVFLLVISNSQLFAQTFDQLIELSNNAYRDSSFVEAGKYFEKAFDMHELNESEYYLYYIAASAFSVSGKLDKAISYLQLSMQNGDQRRLSYVMLDPYFNNIRELPSFQELIKKNRLPETIYAIDIIEDISNNRNNNKLVYENKHIDLSIPWFQGVTTPLINNDSLSLSFNSCYLVRFRLNNINIGKLRFFDCIGSFGLFLIQVQAKSVYVSTNQSPSGFNKTTPKNGFANIDLINSNIQDLTILSGGDREDNVIRINKSTFNYVHISSGGNIILDSVNVKFIEENWKGNSSKTSYEYSIQKTLPKPDSPFNTGYLLSTSFRIYAGGALTINGCRFSTTNLWETVMIGHVGELYIGNSVFDSPVEIFGKVEGGLNIEDSEFNKPLDLSRASLLEYHIYFPYSQINDGLSVFSVLLPSEFEDKLSCWRCYLFKAQGDAELAETKNYDLLVNQHRLLYNNYKQRGEIESANSVFVSIKDLVLRHHGYIYRRDGGFRNLFRYRLAQIMKTYTNHGTDPSLAMLISLYIILVFAVFYFFYPSEWDTTSKARLISNFKDFRQKNDKGYIKPFFIMLGGFALSLINAFTLSLNSFVTLGFGTIPTKGLARYVCIIQGFIGWFLLSIFTVALINQVLF